jgi:hypothetical protein
MPEPRPQTVSTRATYGIFLFVFCSVLSTARILVDSPNPAHIVSDHISGRSDERFVALKSRLPEYGVVGYIGDSGPSAIPDYYLAEYALAPLVLDRSPDHQLVLGNYPSSMPPEIPPTLRLIQDFGNGVLLFATKDAQ